MKFFRTPVETMGLIVASLLKFLKDVVGVSSRIVWRLDSCNHRALNAQVLYYSRLNGQYLV